MPASATPPGRSHIAPRWSDQRPNSGWSSDDETRTASINAAVAVYERSNSSERKGRSAGTAPEAKSTERCPPESVTIALRSSSPVMSRGYSSGTARRRSNGRPHDAANGCRQMFAPLAAPRCPQPAADA
jgi:hypothetical protein